LGSKPSARQHVAAVAPALSLRLSVSFGSDLSSCVLLCACSSVQITGDGFFAPGAVRAFPSVSGCGNRPAEAGERRLQAIDRPEFKGADHASPVMTFPLFP